MNRYSQVKVVDRNGFVLINSGPGFGVAMHHLVRIASILMSQERGCVERNRGWKCGRKPVEGDKYCEDHGGFNGS